MKTQIFSFIKINQSISSQSLNFSNESLKMKMERFFLSKKMKISAWEKCKDCIDISKCCMWQICRKLNQEILWKKFEIFKIARSFFWENHFLEDFYAIKVLDKNRFVKLKNIMLSDFRQTSTESIISEDTQHISIQIAKVEKKRFRFLIGILVIIIFEKWN